ncbi:heterokaryon incompatibility protein-domain-containing protein [Paraphoma chrysanthemicola]|nr:heterokaryon incompatibility protein-domain-containing protein [Paraphoma chrysanthemicola]
MKPYVYNPLLKAQQSIRLLQILPGSAGQDVRCVLYDYTIQQDRASGPYEALSYVWGNSDDKHRIFVEADQSVPPGKSQSYLEITRNLFVALRRFRDRFAPRLVWIDAICINQQDVVERALQVHFMANIYFHTSRVIVWLGEEADDSGDLLAQIEETAIRNRDSFGDSSSQSTRSAELLQYRKETQISKKALMRFLERPWFHRIWVLQEVAAGRCLLLVCGQAEVTGTTFTHGLLACLHNLEPSHRNFGASVVHMMSWEAPGLQYRGTGSTISNDGQEVCLGILPLGQLLDRFHEHDASDPRDKIYALLGICRSSDHSSPLLMPDYTKSWSAVFQAAIHYLLGSASIVTTWNDRQQAVVTGYG